MRLRAAAGLAALALVLTASPGSAAPLRFADPPGDGPAKQTSFDIVWVEFRTKGTGTGRKYVPWDLVVTMRLNNVPYTTPGARYVVEADVEGCGLFRLSYVPFVATPYATIMPTSEFLAGCDDGEFLDVDVRFEIRGSSLVWTVPITDLPTRMRAGARYTELRAYAEPGDPFVGGTGSVIGSALAADVATSSETWVLG